MKPSLKIHGRLTAFQSSIATCLLMAASVQFSAAQTNTATGINAGKKTTSGKHNTSDGFRALISNRTGSFNTAAGSNALASSNGSNNVALGFKALFKNKVGGFNVALGDGALLNNRVGSANIALGEDAGFNIIGSNNICIANKGLAADSGIIRIGTDGVHNNTFIAGVLTGDGSGLTGVTVPSGSITGGIAGAQIVNNSITSTQLAPASVTPAQLASASVTSAKLALNLTLGGTTTGTFSGNLTGNATTATTATSATNATTATNAAGLLAPNLKLSTATVGSFGDTTAFQFNSGTAGLLLESNSPNESGGIFLNGNTAVIYSPGDNGNVLSVFDEDQLNDVTPVAGFRVLNGTLGIATPGNVTFGSPSLSAVGGDEQLRIVRGSVDSDGTITKGSGFSVTKGAVGSYTINFTTPFGSAPSVTCTLNGSLGRVVGFFSSGATASGYAVLISSTTDVAADRNFDFIAVGPR